MIILLLNSLFGMVGNKLISLDIALVFFVKKIDMKYSYSELNNFLCSENESPN